MTSVIYDSVRMFQVNNNVCPLLSIPFNGAVGNNQLLVAAVTGKRIRVMGLIAQSDTATVGRFQLEDGSGGAQISAALSTPPVTNGDVLFMPIVECGYCETSTGTGLYCDIVTAAINMQVWYITYTPV